MLQQSNDPQPTLTARSDEDFAIQDEMIATLMTQLEKAEARNTELERLNALLRTNHRDETAHGQMVEREVQGLLAALNTIRALSQPTNMMRQSAGTVKDVFTTATEAVERCGIKPTGKAANMTTFRAAQSG